MRPRNKDWWLIGLGFVTTVIFVVMAITMIRISQGASDQRTSATANAAAVCRITSQCNAAAVAEQMRSARAAELSADLAVYQVIVGMLGTVFVGATLVFARRSTSAAIAAADAAQRSVENSERTSRKQLRAYLFPSLDSPIYRGGVRAPNGLFLNLTFDVQVRNAGSTPATKVTLGALMREVVWPNDNEPERPSGVQSQATIGPNETAKITISQSVKVSELSARSDNQQLYVRVLISYEDVFGDPHALDYHWVVQNSREWLDRAEQNVPGTVNLACELLSERSSSD